MNFYVFVYRIDVTKRTLIVLRTAKEDLTCTRSNSYNRLMASKQAFSKLQTKNSTQTLSICFMLLALVVPCYCAPASSGKHLHSAAAAVKDTSDADDSGRLTSGHVTRSSHYHPGYTVSFIEDGKNSTFNFFKFCKIA